MSGRWQPPAEPAGHAVRPDDEVKMEAEDGDEAQHHQAETLQSTGHLLIPDHREPDVDDGLSSFRSLLLLSLQSQMQLCQVSLWCNWKHDPDVDLQIL